MDIHNGKFGCINTDTGEVLAGHMKNGKQHFKRPSWWKRTFCKVWSDWETIGSVKAVQRYSSFFQSDVKRVPYRSILQKRTHIYTGESQYRVSDIDGDWQRIDSRLYEGTGHIVVSPTQ